MAFVYRPGDELLATEPIARFVTQDMKLINAESGKAKTSCFQIRAKDLGELSVIAIRQLSSDETWEIGKAHVHQKNEEVVGRVDFLVSDAHENPNGKLPVILDGTPFARHPYVRYWARSEQTSEQELRSEEIERRLQIAQHLAEVSNPVRNPRR